MNIDERLQALTMNLELMSHDRENDRARHAAEHKEVMEQLREHTRQIDAHTRQLEMDAEHIRALARIAGAHQDRLDHLN